MNKNFDYNADMPSGLKMALAQNFGAMERFMSLDEQKQAEYIKGAANVNTRQDMKAYVDNLTQG